MIYQDTFFEPIYCTFFRLISQYTNLPIYHDSPRKTVTVTDEKQIKIIRSMLVVTEITIY